MQVIIERLYIITKTEITNSFLECPNGFTYQEGDYTGAEISMATNLDSIGDCGFMCNNKEGCKSIEWSPSTNKCILVDEADADGPKYLDFIFCSKGLRKIRFF